MPYTHAIQHLEREAAILAATSINPEKEAQDIEKLPSISDAISYLKVANLGGLSALVSLVRQWGSDKGITGPNAKATVASQHDKLLEEVQEIAEGILANDQHAIVDGIGDATVVLILLAELSGVKFETCLCAAWDEIKGRTGVMRDGVFVRDKA